MGRVLAFDTNELAALIRETDKTKGQINEESRALKESVYKLKKDWNTTAGRKFFSTLDFDWTPEINKYLKVLDTFNILLEEAIEKYSEVEESINAIRSDLL